MTRAARRAALLAVAAAFAAPGLFAGCSRKDGLSFNATDITGVDYGKELALDDHFGKPRTLADFRGKVVVVFFGFTHCPDVCPTTLLTIANALKQLGPQADQVQVLFVTLDPERDDAKMLAQYVPAFHPTFIGLRGDAAATQKAAREFKVFYQKTPLSTPGNYTVDHTSAAYVIDKQGRLRLFVRHTQTAEQLAQDLKQLLS
ncbi:MAG TPA: SCO family protein [Burkholderiaceae bacterium]|nr:SCO family protein [Burkholderiaceae bacterium]